MKPVPFTIAFISGLVAFTLHVDAADRLGVFVSVYIRRVNLDAATTGTTRHPPS